MTDLTRRVIAFQLYGDGFDEIVQQASLLIYAYPATVPTLTEDDCGDFLIFFVPRLRTLIRNYRPERAEFEPYLRMCMRYRIMSYLASRHRSCRYEPADSYIGSWDLQETPADVFPKQQPIDTIALASLLDTRTQRALRRLSRKSVLCFCLKAICDADDETIVRMAQLCATDVTWLIHCRYLLLSTLTPRRARLKRMGARTGRLYERIYNLEYRYFRETDPEIRAELDRKIQVSKRLYDQNCSRARRLTLRPTNRDIASILHVAKGTVDHAVYAVRNALTRALMEGDQYS